MFLLSSQSPEFLRGIEASAGARPTQPISATAQAAVPQRPRAQARLLSIEDNPVNQLVIEELLAQRPAWQLSLAADGRQGLSQAVALLPDLILLDLELPDMSGFQVLQALRAQRPTAGIPCIALSANAMPEDMRRAREAGFADYWTKPVDFKAFHAGLDQFLSGLQGTLKPAADLGS